jgi:hypothetical protein
MSAKYREPYGYGPIRHGNRPWTTNFIKPNEKGTDILAPVAGAPPHDRLPGLWQFAGMVWMQLTEVYGHQLQLIRQEYLVVKSYRRVADWIRNLELLVRRILFIAASALELAPSRGKAGAWGICRFRRTFLDDPLTWKVSFRVLQARRASRPTPVRGRRKTDPEKRLHFLPTRPLAMRIEALRRAIKYRDDHIRRLARRLHRMQAANRSANQPRGIELKAWDYHPDRRTPGKHAVARGMTIAQPMAEAAQRKFDPG